MAESEIKLAASRADVGGDIAVADLVIAKLAGRAAQLTYGVLGMRESPLAGIARLFKGPFTKGVDVDLHDGCADVTLHVVMERGINLAQVTENLREQVRFEVESQSGVKLGQVNVRVEDVRE
jgi:uncharacterized alkaline shock family protein YloU